MIGLAFLLRAVPTIADMTEQGAVSGRGRGDPANLEVARHADALQVWLDRLRTDYAQHSVAVNAEIAVRWGVLVDANPQFPVDMLIAATALERGLAVATRNEEHFRLARVPVVNPFKRQARRPT